MRGACSIRADGEERVFFQGDIVEIGGGFYELTVLGTSELELVQVWDLTPYMN